jgi:hypothetical protein
LYLLFLDESGNKTGKTDVFVLTGTCIHESEMVKLDDDIRAFKTTHFSRYVSDVELIDIHAEKMIKGKEIFSLLAEEARYEAFADFMKLLSTSNITLLSIVINRYAAFTGYDPEEWALKLMMERFIMLVNRRNRVNQENGLTPDYGLLLFDTINKEADGKTWRMIRDMRKGTDKCQNTTVFCDPVFVDSKEKCFIQCSDMAGYCLRRWLNHDLVKWTPSKEDIFLFGCLDTIMPKYDKSPEGKVMNYGIKIAPRWP